MSFGQDEDSPAVTRAVAAAERRGMVLVAAAGNDGGDNTVDFPARLPTVLAVTGCDQSDRIMRNASRGPEVDLAAPGRGIVSLGRGGGRRVLSGTSMATPHVTGVVALLLAARPALSPAEVRRILADSAEPLGNLAAEEQGAGLVRADRALEQALGITLVPPGGADEFPQPEVAARN